MEATVGTTQHSVLMQMGDKDVYTVRSLLLQAQRTFEDWQDLADEMLTLTQYGGSVDSDKIEQILDECRSVYDTIINIRDMVELEEDMITFNTLLDSYIGVWEDLHDSMKLNEINQFELSDADKVYPKMKPIDSPVVEVEHLSKSVRFKDNIIESSPPVRFKPYKDSVDEFVEGISDTDLDNPQIDMSNAQIFIHNQNQFEYQDAQLENLHSTIRQQKHISQTINTELSEQFVILDDLESGIDESSTRLERANNRLTHYRNALKKRGDWMCIFILTVILLFLLIVL